MIIRILYYICIYATTLKLNISSCFKYNYTYSYLFTCILVNEENQT